MARFAAFPGLRGHARENFSRVSDPAELANARRDCFFRPGVYASVPALRREKRRGRPPLPKAIRMLPLMAALAHRLKLALARIRIPDTQGEVGACAQVLNVMHYRRPRVPVLLLSADPALAMIQPQNLSADLTPLRPPVKTLLMPLHYQLAELSEAAIAYHRRRPSAHTATQGGSICRKAPDTLPRSCAAHIPPPGSLRSSAGTACGGYRLCPLCASKSLGAAGCISPSPPL